MKVKHNIIKRELVKPLLFNLYGKIFGATFKKKDGSIRNINCRTGVSKHLKGGKRTTYGYSNLLCVYDVQNKGYRYINLDTLSTIRANKEEYHVE